MKNFDVGDLVRDVLNNGDGSYGLGVVVSTASAGLRGEQLRMMRKHEAYADADIPGHRYDVYFNKFERIITFHGDYLEKV